MKKVKLVKRILAICLIFLLSIDSFAAVVSDNDGSAFVTKAEFDALKEAFRKEIDVYNNSIDRKIDGAIASYLAGLSISQDLNIYVDTSDTFKFLNNFPSQRDDQGLNSMSSMRISKCYGLTGISLSPTGTWYKPKKKFLLLTRHDDKVDWTQIITNVEWADSYTADAKKIAIGFKDPDIASVAIDPDDLTLDWVTNNIVGPATGYRPAGLNAGSSGVPIAGSLVGSLVKKDELVDVYIWKTSGSPWYNVKGVAQPSYDIAPTFGSEQASNVFSAASDEVAGGRGFALSYKGGLNVLKSFASTITIMNTYTTQSFTYNDCSSGTTSPTAWDDNTKQDITISQVASWDFQDAGTKKDLSSTDTTNSTYWSFQATQLKKEDETVWKDNYQLGKNEFVSAVKCFDESCTLDFGAEQTIPSDDLKFNRTGYYLDASGNLITKTDNVVESGNIKYKNLVWKSEDLAPDTIALESISSMSNETTYLGGGIPLAYSPSDRQGVKVKLDYEVTKEDGSAITAADGFLDIVIRLSNKQFKNGTFDTASGGVDKGLHVAVVHDGSDTGTWTSDLFDMTEKSKIWLNAYVVQQGYNVIIKNINVQ